MSVLANVKQFQDLNALSFNYFSSDVTVADFEANSACWHKSCQKKFQQYQARKGKKKKKKKKRCTFHGGEWHGYSETSN